MLTKEQAVEIASEFSYAEIKSRIYKVVDTLEHIDRTGIFLPAIFDKCWYIFCADAPLGTLSDTGTVIVISKKTGKVVALFTHQR